MPQQKRHPQTAAGFEDACALLERALVGGVRRSILDVAEAAGDADSALRRLRDGMRRHIFKTASEPLVLDGAVRAFDSATREEGFHVLHAWDHGQHVFTKDNTPVLLLDRFARSRVPTRSERWPLSLLLDHYFFYLLAVMAMRSWDEGDANENLDRLTGLIRHLQGPHGSGHSFVEDAETAVLMAISHFHPDESAYLRLLDKIRTLDRAHRIKFALAESAVLASHLRWGFPVLYQRDLGRMRGDNVGDYPWLQFSVGSLVTEYTRMREEDASVEERERVVEGLLDALTPDPWAFTGKPPEALVPYAEEHSELKEQLDRYRGDLLEEFQRLSPTKDAFSPYSFHCNFPHNAIMAKVAIALVDPAAPNLPLNAMFSRQPSEDPDADVPELLARTLMHYSGERPDRLGRHGARLIIYDPNVGLRYFRMAVKTLRENA